MRFSQWMHSCPVGVCAKLKKWKDADIMFFTFCDMGFGHLAHILQQHFATINRLNFATFVTYTKKHCCHLSHVCHRSHLSPMALPSLSHLSMSLPSSLTSLISSLACFLPVFFLSSMSIPSHLVSRWLCCYTPCQSCFHKVKHHLWPRKKGALWLRARLVWQFFEIETLETLFVPKKFEPQLVVTAWVQKTGRRTTAQQRQPIKTCQFRMNTKVLLEIFLCFGSLVESALFYSFQKGFGRMYVFSCFFKSD